jgi:50S ribosomal subunit-associated GTPase HflX
VFNKIDLTGESGGSQPPGGPPPGAEPRGGQSPRVVVGADGMPSQAWASAVTGAGLAGLRDAIGQAVRPNQVQRTLHLAMRAAGVRSDLYRRNAVRAERQCDDGSWELDVELDSLELAKLLGSAGVDLVEISDARRQQRVA